MISISSAPSSIPLHYWAIIPIPGRRAIAFFGYGLDAQNADPSINGFIFNWAGPGNNHTVQEYAQKQEVSYNTTTGDFDSVNANIL